MTRVTTIELAKGWKLAPARVSVKQIMSGGDWMSYSAPVEVNGNVQVRVTTADGKRKGRSLTVDCAKIHGSVNKSGSI